ncbi:response regulator, partial [Salmonella enterica subsp. enterica serovar Virginia]|nr:response regulator [Salmonella enterica subsp. enterica serovar Virginia]
MLEDIKGIKVVGEACCGEDAVKWCRTNAVDVVLMDMNMPGIGMDPSTQFLKVMMIDEPAVLDRAIARIPAEVKEKYTVLKSAPY